MYSDKKAVNLIRFFFSTKSILVEFTFFHSFVFNITGKYPDRYICEIFFLILSRLNRRQLLTFIRNSFLFYLQLIFYFLVEKMFRFKISLYNPFPMKYARRLQCKMKIHYEQDKNTKIPLKFEVKQIINYRNVF